MSTVTIHLVDPDLMLQFYIKSDQVETARKAMRAGCYTACSPFEVNQTGEEAAEEAFDLTNNPSRQNEREELYGNGRSVSVRDIVDVDGVRYLCLSAGWKQI